MNHLVSVIMPCHNGARFLSYSVESVRVQSYSNWELIAVNDGSTDGSGEMLEDFTEKDARISVLHQQNAGLPAARNRGIFRARGRYVAFLDADDSWHQDFLFKMVSALENRPDAAMAYCGWRNIGLPNGRGKPFVPPNYETPNKAEILLRGCRWPVHGALVRLTTLLDIGGFDESLKSCEDYDLWLRLSVYNPIVLVPEVLAYYHHHDAQMIRNRARIALSHFKVQQKFLDAHSDLRKSLGRKRIRILTLGELKAKGYESYWKRDLGAARTIFRAVLKHGYGSINDWKYMLPSFLPMRLHSILIRRIDRYHNKKICPK